MKKNIRSVINICRILINKDDEMKFIYQLTFESDEGISDVYFESLGGLFDFLNNECQFMTEKVVEIRSD
jgi:hypothetical protein